MIRFFCFALSAVTAISSALAAPPASDRIAVLISVDGLAHFYFDDPKCEMPNIRALAKEGARARSMKCSLPTVTWPNHTTLVTGVQPGRHGVIGNSYFDRASGKVVPLIPDPLFDKDQIVKTPTIYDVAKEAGLKTAGIIWPATRNAKTLDWTVPDVFPNKLFQQYSTPSLLEEFKAAGIPFEKQEEWCKKPSGGIDRDLMYAKMFNLVVRKHRPNLGLLHVVELDHVEHNKGPQTPEAYAAVKFCDERVGEIWEELKATFPGRATLIVASDHGFFPYQQQIQPNVLLRKEGLLQTKALTIVSAQARAVGQGGASFIYIMDQAKREALIDRVAAMFKDVEGIDVVITPKEFKKYGLVDPKENPQMADIVLSAKKGYSFSDMAGGEIVVTPKMAEVKGTHGYDPNQPDLHGTFVAWGAGIKPGATLGTVESVDVAPTMAAVMGLTMKNVDGRVLAEALQPPAK